MPAFGSLPGCQQRTRLRFSDLAQLLIEALFVVVRFKFPGGLFELRNLFPGLLQCPLPLSRTSMNPETPD
jgi:hypothetical protein